jgi:predicted patatin/cPLA2 family phospholipase
MHKKGKIIWVLPGGGNQASYSCGSLFAAKKMKIPNPDIIVASSGGAANAFYYASNQIERAYEIWGHEISSKKILCGARFWKMFDRDCMVDGVFMQHPNALNLKAVGSSPISIYAGVTNNYTGLVEYFSNKYRVNLLKLLKATITVPFFSGIFKDSSVPIGKFRYSDGRASSRYELLIEKALSFNPKKIIVFGNKKSRRYRYGCNFWDIFWLIGKSIKNLNFDYLKNQLKLLKKQKSFNQFNNPKILFLWPKKELKIPPWDNSSESLQSILKRGYYETMHNKELKEFYGIK